jgi:hypothetical protein
VQYVNVRETAYTDVLGNRTPTPRRSAAGAWSCSGTASSWPGAGRAGSRAEGTRLFDATQAPLPLKPGPTWFLLVPNGRPLAGRLT